MNQDFEWIVSLPFEDVPPPVSFHSIPKLSVSAQGVMTMNQPLQKALEGTRLLHMQVSADGRTVKLVSSEEGDLHFSLKGQLKNTKFRDMLQKEGVQLPCRYQMEWWQEQAVWIGCSEDLPAPPDMDRLPRRRRRKTP